MSYRGTTGWEAVMIEVTALKFTARTDAEVVMMDLP